MERKLYKELWQKRFEKMLKLEEESIVDYELLLRECKKHFPDQPALQTHFERLIRDEKRHAKLCKELIQIAKRQEVNT